MAWSIMNPSSLCVKNIEVVTDGFVVDLDWSSHGEDFIVVATSKVADYVRRLSFAKKVTYRGHYVFVKVKTHRTGGWRGPWLVVSEMPGKRTIATMRRTINNKMPGIAFWAKKEVAKRAQAKADHPSRATQVTGSIALGDAIQHALSAVVGQDAGPIDWGGTVYTG